MIAEAGAVRLLLGGRETRIPGFLNVDLQSLPSVDLLADISKLDFIPDGQVEEIYASHVLEHFPWIRTLDVLKEWRRVLRPGGVAYLSVPDFAVLAKFYAAEGLGQYVIELLFGEPHKEFGAHMAAFDYPRMARLLVEAGFSDVERLEWLPYEVDDCSRFVDNRFNKPISLNVKAIA